MYLCNIRLLAHRATCLHKRCNSQINLESVFIQNRQTDRQTETLHINLRGQHSKGSHYSTLDSLGKQCPSKQKVETAGSRYTQGMEVGWGHCRHHR